MIDDNFNIQELLNEIEDIVRFVLKKIDLDNSSFAKKITIEWIDERVVVSMPEYGEFIDKGRKKNSRMPPIKSIKEFIRSKNITSTDLTTDQLAFAIAKSISIKGVKARPFIESLTEETFNLVSEHIYNEINKMLAQVFN